MQIKSAEYAGSAAKSRQFLKRPIPHFVFAGRSNVGKSSLLNLLLRRKKLAHTSKKPGKTRLVNYFLINDRFYFIDLPGYGFAQVSHAEKEQWGKLIESYLKETPYVAVVFLLLDIRHEPSAQDRQMLEWLNHFQIPYTIILTKADKLSKSQSLRQRAKLAKSLAIDSQSIVATSINNASGISDIWAGIDHLYESTLDDIKDLKESTPC